MPSEARIKQILAEELGKFLPSNVGIADNVGIGRTFYVNNAASNESDTTGGASWRTPMATIAAAIAKCVAGRGDVILCGPGHAETISTAAAIALSVAGVSLIGVGTGSNRPTLTWATGTDATITIAGANVRISNFIFNMALPSALISGLVWSGAGGQIDNCRFHIGTAGAGTRPLQAILTVATANYLQILDNQFLEPALTPTTVSAASCAIKLVGGTGIRISGNTFIGWYTTTVGAITSITTLNDNIEISKNRIINRTTSATKGVVLLTGSNGTVSDNVFGIGSGAAPITADALHWGRNWSAAAVATDSTLV